MAAAAAASRAPAATIARGSTSAARRRRARTIARPAKPTTPAPTPAVSAAIAVEWSAPRSPGLPASLLWLAGGGAPVALRPPLVPRGGVRGGLAGVGAPIALRSPLVPWVV